MKRVTIREVAQRAGVSAATVSRVLSNHAAISEETKALVRETCREMNYVPDMAARGLSGHSTHTIGVILPDISNPYFSGMYTAIEQRASELGYRVLLSNTLHDPRREQSAIDQILSHQVDGIMISAYSPQTQEQQAPLIGTHPCVYLGSNHGPACSYVEVDNERGAYEATQYLVHLGHRKIVFLGGRTSSRTLEQRLKGYRRSLLEHGLPPQEITAPDDVGGLRHWCYQRAKALLWGGALPDAIIAYSDIFAMRVLEAAGEYGLHAPEDFSILGFDDIAFGCLPQIRLTTVSQKKIHSGRLAVERLVEQMQGSRQRSADVLLPELIIRGTCRKI